MSCFHSWDCCVCISHTSLSKVHRISLLTANCMLASRFSWSKWFPSLAFILVIVKNPTSQSQVVEIRNIFFNAILGREEYSSLTYNQEFCSGSSWNFFWECCHMRAQLVSHVGHQNKLRNEPSFVEMGTEPNNPSDNHY